MKTDEISFGDENNDGDFVVEQTQAINESQPSITDYEWSDYVLKHLHEDEFFKGNPTVDGLRRIVPLLLGPILSDTTTVVQTPTPDNNHRATVVCEITIGGYEQVCFSGAADVYRGNIDKEYARYPVATAETRAEGRALRKALRLRKVIAAEEITTEPFEDEIQNITLNQRSVIDRLCNRLDINVKKYVNNGIQQYDKITEVGFEYAVQLVKTLLDYQHDAIPIPSNIINYDENWRDGFDDQASS